MAIVILTDLKTEERIAIIRTDLEGNFRVALAVRDVALTAAAEGEVAYVPSLDIGSHGSPIALSASCSELRGTIDMIGHAPNGLIAQVSRISDNVGDTFGTTLQADGQFHVCVPPAFYIVTFPHVIAPRRNVAVVPGGPMSFRMATNMEIDRALEDRQDILPEPASSFIVGLASTVRVLGIGESNHGTREYSEERTRLAIDLARQKDFSFIMIEAGYGETLALDEYVNGANTDIRSAVTRLGYWPWDTEMFLDSLERLKVYNASLPLERHVHVIGFDIQTTTGAVDYLIHSHDAKLSSDDAARLSRLDEDKGKHWKEFSSGEKTTIRGILEKVARDDFHDGAGAFSHKSQTALAARSLLLRIELLEASSPLQEELSRDAGMSRMILDVLALSPRARVLLWAHLAHLSREYLIGAPTVGQHLSARLGVSYQVYAMLSYSGSVRAWDTKSKVGVIPHQIPRPPISSVEAVLYQRRRGSSITYWEFARTTGSAARWLGGLHRLCEFGAVHPGDGNVFVLWDLHSIDGAILFDRVTPSVPTPTGGRVAAPTAR